MTFIQMRLDIWRFIPYNIVVEDLYFYELKFGGSYLKVQKYGGDRNILY